jgi:hypothetical protein
MPSQQENGAVDHRSLRTACVALTVFWTCRFKACTSIKRLALFQSSAAWKLRPKQTSAQIAIVTIGD